MEKALAIVAIFLILFTDRSCAVSPLCNKKCTECRAIFPLIKEAAERLRVFYIEQENEISAYYDEHIIKHLKVRDALIKEREKLLIEIKLLEYQNTITQEEITRISQDINSEDVK